LIPALRILFEVAVYRLRRLEMANIFAGLTIALALGLSAAETVVRVVFLLLLNVLALLGNDCFDVDQDMVSPQRYPPANRTNDPPFSRSPDLSAPLMSRLQTCRCHANPITPSEPAYHGFAMRQSIGSRAVRGQTMPGPR
jgi:hypothetical protein